MYIKIHLFALLFFSLIATAAPGKSPSTDSLYQLGISLYDCALEAFEKNPDSGYHYLRQAFPLLEEGEAWPEYVNCINAFFAGEYESRNFLPAERYATLALDAARRHLQPEEEPYITALNNAGVIYADKRDFDRALSCYRQCLDVLRRTGQDSLAVADLLFNTSNAYSGLGDFDAAIPYLEESQRLYRQLLGDQHWKVAAMTFEQGRAYQQKNDLPKAVSYYRHSLSMLGATSLRPGSRSFNYLIDAHHRLAETYLSLGRRDSVFYFLDQVLPLQSGDRPRRKYLTYELRAKAFLQGKNWRSALGDAKTALDFALAEYQGFEQHKVLARLHTQLGDILLAAGKTGEALDAYQRGLNRVAVDFGSMEIFRNPEPATIISSLDGLRLLRAKGSALMQHYLANPDKGLRPLEASLETCETARLLIHRTRQDLFTTNSKEQLAGEVLPVYELALNIAVLLHQLTGEDRFLRQAFTFAESNKGLQLLESLQESAAKNYAGIPDSLIEKERSIAVDIAFYERAINEEKLSPSTNVERVEEYSRQKFALEQAQQELSMLLTEKFPRYEQAKTALPITGAEQIPKNILDGHTALLEYFVGERSLFIFYLDHQEIKAFQLEKPALFSATVQRLAEIVRTPPTHDKPEQDFQDFTLAAHQVYEWLLAPVLSAVSTGPERLIIIPDEWLNRIPFEVLLREPPAQGQAYFQKDMPYLCRDYQIAYSYSASLLEQSMHLKPTAISKKTFLGLAPVFGETTARTSSQRSCSPADLYSLQCSQEEVTAIRDLLGGEVLLGQEAVRSRFEAEARKYRILHLATHACPDEEHPMLSRIFLTDDYLSNYDLINLQLSAELVVLSACNTGFGKLVPGEGVMSLSKGFIQAGVPSALISLWAVDDCVTSRIMEDFYLHLSEGLPKDEAIRRTKLAYLRSADKLHQHPYYWAPFIEMGNFRALEMNNHPDRRSWWWWGLLLVIPLWFAIKKHRGNR